MHRPRVIVLKLGGSVLSDQTTLRRAVHEIYRWRREGWSVVAVVSALAGTTDELLRGAYRICERPAPWAVATLVSNGESHCAALLGLHLDRAGVDARVLTPAAIGFVAGGDPLDAWPAALDAAPLRRALQRGAVAVVPGYAALDADGGTVVLGRGGSDLTALFLADRLGADRCRLVKDVDGLYERDPALGGTPRRFERATWDDALATDGTIVQHKALRFARERSIELELGRWNGVRPTRIGSRPTRFARAADRPVKRRVALLGLGTVGGGVWELARRLPGELEVVAVAVRDPARARDAGVPRELVTTDVVGAATAGADVVVEALGGLDPAGRAVEAALAAGADVVTANKRLLAESGAALRALAGRHGCRLLGSASVGGSAPVLERVRVLRPRDVRSVRAVLNGTTNFVLGELARGRPLDGAVREAQALGLAERDPSRDLSGEDALDKLFVIAGELGFDAPVVGRREPVAEHATPRRHVATLRVGPGLAEASVRLAAPREDDPLADVPAEHNAAVIELADGTREVVRGKGAGRWPTAEAVVADLLELVRDRRPAARRPRALDTDAVQVYPRSRLAGSRAPSVRPSPMSVRTQGSTGDPRFSSRPGRRS